MSYKGIRDTPETHPVRERVQSTAATAPTPVLAARSRIVLVWDTRETRPTRPMGDVPRQSRVNPERAFARNGMANDDYRPALGAEDRARRR